MLVWLIELTVVLFIWKKLEENLRSHWNATRSYKNGTRRAGPA
jgi:hypothetical protein